MTPSVANMSVQSTVIVTHAQLSMYINLYIYKEHSAEGIV